MKKTEIMVLPQMSMMSNVFTQNVFSSDFEGVPVQNIIILSTKCITDLMIYSQMLPKENKYIAIHRFHIYI